MLKCLNFEGFIARGTNPYSLGEVKGNEIGLGGVMINECRMVRRKEGKEGEVMINDWKWGEDK